MVILVSKYLFLSILLVGSWSYAQESDTIKTTKVKKNVIQGSVGFIFYSAGAQLNYERQLIQFQDQSLSGLWANAGIGYWGVIAGYGGPYQHVSLGLLGGHENNHFEFTFGVGRLNNAARGGDDYGQSPVPSASSKDINYSPIGTMGYRYQKPGGSFVFRCGVSYPPLPYFGFGLAF